VDIAGFHIAVVVAVDVAALGVTMDIGGVDGGGIGVVVGTLVCCLDVGVEDATEIIGGVAVAAGGGGVNTNSGAVGVGGARKGLRLRSMLQNVLLIIRRSRWGDLPTTVILISVAILVFCVVLLPSVIFPLVGLYIVWRLPQRKKITLYAAYVYLIAAVAALWYLEIALSDRGIDYFGTGYIGIVPSAAVTGLTALLLILSFVDSEGRAQFK
jgi:hypothetical protein